MIQPAFTAATRSTLELLADANRTRRCNLLIGSNTVSAESAMLALLLDRLLRRAGGRGGPWRTLFVSSGVEAVGAAIKLCRHTAVRRRAGEGALLVVDPTGGLRLFFDPTGQGFSHALVPALRFVDSVETAAALLGRRRWAGAVVPHGQWVARPRVHGAFAEARRRAGSGGPTGCSGSSPTGCARPSPARPCSAGWPARTGCCA